MADASLTVRDAAVMWHPYGTMPPAAAALPVAAANGVRIELIDGRVLIDGMSSWWAAIHGYRHPRIDAAVTAQLATMAHVMFGGLTHEPAVKLGEQLVALTPEGLEHVFLCDSGSVSVEVAIKMVLQYWQARSEPRRTRLLALRGGYHGDTFGAMALCDPVRGMHQLFSSVLAQHVFAERPPGGVTAALDADWCDRTERLFAEHAGELAAVIVEPIVQGAGGMHFYAPAYLRALADLCRVHDVLLIFDEIATGFGRIGAMFAAELAGVVPDVMCVGKALTGGYMTLAATLCSRAVAEGISAGAGPLMHGPTFMANPLACAASLASLELLSDGGWRRDVERISRALANGLAPARELPGVADVRVLGAIGVIELSGPVDVSAATDAAVARGVWLRPFADLVYTMPPYIATDDELAAICEAAVAAAAAGRPPRRRLSGESLAA